MNIMDAYVEVDNDEAESFIFEVEKKLLMGVIGLACVTFIMGLYWLR